MSEVRRTPEERFATLPGFDYEPRYVEWEGLRLAYLDEGEGPPVVCFHGEPTWSFLYRKMIDPIVATGYRVICPDYFGFGRSDKPTDPEAYSYDRHTAAMGDLLDHLGIAGATAVVQDWGGPIGLRLAVERSPMFDRLCILNTGLFTGEAPSEGFLRWRRFVASQEDLPIRFIMERSMVRPWDDAVLDGYEAPYPDRSYKEGAHRFPLIVPLAEDEPGAAEMQRVATALAAWAQAALVLFADQDPVFIPSVAERLAALIPGADTARFISGAGHFLQEDAGEEVAARVVEFLAATER